MTQAVSRVPPTVIRTVNTKRLETLVAGNLKDAARKIAGPENRDIERVRRKLQRALRRGTMEQVTAEEIGAGLAVDPETFLEPYQRPDPRLLELRRLLRRADTLRRDLGLEPRHYADELAIQDE